LTLQTMVILLASLMSQLDLLYLSLAAALGRIGLAGLNDAIKVCRLVVIRLHAVIFTNRDNYYKGVKVGKVGALGQRSLNYK
jgi:hypothetical protein